MASGTLGDYLEELRHALAQLDLGAVEAVVRELLAVRRRGGRVFLFGNGGSCALASHMATDLSLRGRVDGLAPLRTTALVDNLPSLTALANDVGYTSVFAEQLRIECRPGDLAIAVSCSGSSGNVIEGVRAARELGARVVGLTGDDGGELPGLTDVCVAAPAARIEQQEDLHLAVNHAVTVALRAALGRLQARAARPPRALVLAAGVGSRLGPLTRDRPKAMLPVGGRPLIERTLNWLRAAGVSEIAVNLHHHGEVLADHLGDGERFGVRLHYSRERSLRGTAGALRELDGFLDGSPLLVVYGDVLTDLDLRELIGRHDDEVALDPGTAATLSLVPASDPERVGLVATDAHGRVTRFVEKPRPDQLFPGHANAGVFVLESWVVNHVPPGTCYDFGQDLFPKLLAADVKLRGWLVDEGCYLLDVGTPETYERAQREWPSRAADPAVASEAAR